jgi:hypothetical protein
MPTVDRGSMAPWPSVVGRVHTREAIEGSDAPAENKPGGTWAREFEDQRAQGRRGCGRRPTLISCAGRPLRAQSFSAFRPGRRRPEPTLLGPRPDLQDERHKDQRRGDQQNHSNRVADEEGEEATARQDQADPQAFLKIGPSTMPITTGAIGKPASRMIKPTMPATKVTSRSSGLPRTP